MSRASHEDQAYLIRQASDSLGLTQTLAKATRVLADHGIPSLLVGGIAVQEYGYARYTADVDLVVPDVQVATQVLASDGFEEKPGLIAVLTDETGFEVHLHAGGAMRGPLPLPIPEIVSTAPQIASLSMLVSIKMSSYLRHPARHMQDAADVIALIQANRLPREYPVEEAVRREYVDLWDKLDQDVEALKRWTASRQ